MRRVVLILLICSFCLAEKNASTLGLESFLGGQAGEAGEIELAKIRIANLLAQKAALEREAELLEAKRKEREANLVSVDDPAVVALFEQIAKLKAQIAELSGADKGNSRISNTITKDTKDLQGEYIK